MRMSEGKEDEMLRNMNGWYQWIFIVFFLEATDLCRCDE